MKMDAKHYLVIEFSDQKALEDFALCFSRRFNTAEFCKEYEIMSYLFIHYEDDAGTFKVLLDNKGE